MIYRMGFQSELSVANALIDKYGKCDNTEYAHCDAAFTLFSKMSKEGLTPDLVTWNAMFSGYIQSRRSNEALSLLQDIALIDMYSKCGSVEDAWNIFSSAPFKNVASWNAMIGCYGKHVMVVWLRKV
ncbi:hypothetical protein P3S68_004134 [Capsicum galapagoense]